MENTSLAEQIGVGLLGLLIVGLLVAATWMALTKKRVGFQTADDNDFALPCTHPVIEVALTYAHMTANGAQLATAARCKWCAASLVDRLAISAESDGRFVVENATNETLCIIVDGEMHHLVPMDQHYPAAHVVRMRDGDRVSGNDVRNIDSIRGVTLDD